MRHPVVLSVWSRLPVWSGSHNISVEGFFFFFSPISFIHEVEYLFLFNPLVSPFCWLLLMSFSMQTLNQLYPTWAVLSEGELSPSGFLKISLENPKIAGPVPAQPGDWRERGRLECSVSPGSCSLIVPTPFVLPSSTAALMQSFLYSWPRKRGML